MIPIKSKTTKAAVRPHAKGEPLFDPQSDFFLPPGSGKAGQRPPSLSEGPDPMALLRALRRRWPAALAVGLGLAAVAGVAAWFLLAAPFIVFGQLHFASAQPRLVFETASHGGPDFRTYLRTQASQIKSRFVLNAVLKRDDIRSLPLVREQDDPVTWLEKELKIEPGASEILTVSLDCHEPEQAVPLVNAIMQVYINEVNNMEQKRRADRLAELDDIHLKLKEKLRVKRETLRRLSEDVGTTEAQALAQRQVVLLTNYTEAKRHHSQVKFELLRAQARLATLIAVAKKLDDVPVSETEVLEIIERDPVVVQHRDRINRLQEIVRDYEQTAARPDEYALVVARRQLQEYTALLDKRIGELRGTIVEQVRKKHRSDHENLLREAQNEVAILTEQEKILLAEAEKLNVESGKVNSSSTEFEMLRAEIEQEEKVSRRIGEEIDALQVEIRSPARVSLYQEAAVQTRDMKKQVMGTVAAPVAMLALVGLGFGWWEHRQRRIRTADDVVGGLGIRVLGSVPPMSQWKRPAGRDGEEDPFPDLETIDGLRTILLRDPSFGDPRVIMIASAGHGEGKTALATQLAFSLAKSGHKTLLIDGDLRSPALHQLFELPPEPGLCESLFSSNDVHAVVQPTANPSLFVIPAGKWVASTHQVLTRHGLQKVFEELKNEFDYLIIDSHPVLDATDTLLMSQDVDAVILSLLRDVSRAPQVYAAYRRLAVLDVRVAGAVINGLPQDDHVLLV